MGLAWVTVMSCDPVSPWAPITSLGNPRGCQGAVKPHICGAVEMQNHHQVAPLGRIIRMKPIITRQKVRIATGSADEDGWLLFADGSLVAVLVHLSEPSHGALRGTWFIEWGVGHWYSPRDPNSFTDIDTGTVDRRAVGSALMAVQNCATQGTLLWMLCVPMDEN